MKNILNLVSVGNIGTRTGHLPVSESTKEIKISTNRINTNILIIGV